MGAVVPTVLFIAMEAAWIGALALFVDAVLGGGGGAAVLWVLALYPLGLMAEQGLRRIPSTPWGDWLLRAAAFCVGAALAVLFVLPEGGRIWDTGQSPLSWLASDARGHRVAAVLCLGLFCWIRGAMLSGRELTAYAVALGFQIGLVVFLAVLALSSGLGIDWPGAVGLSLAFILGGLLTLWHLRAGRRARHGGAARRNPAAAILGLAAVLGLGLILAAGFDRALLDLLLALAIRAGEAIGAFLAFLLSLLPQPDPDSFDLPEQLEMPGVPAPAEPRPFLRPSDLFRRIFEVIFFGTLGISLAILLFGNLRALLAWLRKRRDHTPGLDVDRSRHGIADTLRSLWKALRAALAAGAARLRGALRFRRPEGQTAGPMRRAYLRTERRLGQRGWPRQPYETPFDYERRLKAEWPGPGTDLAVLTRGYVNARYGHPRPVSAPRLRKFLRKIGRSVNKVRYRETHAENAGRQSD